MGKIFTTILFILSITGCNLDNTATPSDTLDINSASTIKHWPLSAATLPLQLVVSSNFATDEINAISAIKDEWNSADTSFSLFKPVLNTTGAMDTGMLSDYRDGVLGIYKITNWFPEVSSSALAVTQFFAYPRVDSSGHSYYEIVHADVLVNYRDHQFSINPAPYSFQYDLTSVVLHELGHLLGLGHVNDFSISSVMLPTLSLGEQRRQIYNRDIDDIIKLYSPVDGSISTASNIIGQNSDAELVRGIIELREDGQCRHYFLPVK